MQKKYIAIAAAIGGVMAGTYLAGVAYFLLLGGDYSRVTLITFPEQVFYYHHDPRYQETLFITGLISYMVALFPALLIVGYKKKPSLHGDARFSTSTEIANAGLYQGEGIIIGRIGRRYLTYLGDYFVLLCSPTRGGKGISFVIPNLLTWSGSVVVIDIKFENFALTSKYRALYGQAVYFFNPFAENAHTHRYNPLFYVRDGIFRVGDILTIANMLYPKIDPKSKFWDASAANLFLGVTLLVKESPDLPFTVGEVRRQGSGKGRSLKEHLSDVLAAREASNTPFSEQCRDALGRFISLSENTMANTLASFNEPLEQWDNEVFDAATNGNDFDLRELRKKNISIYIGVTPNYLPQARLILNLFFSQLINLNTQELPEDNPELKNKCLLMMDEFTAMGTVDILGKGVSFLAGYGIKLGTIVQTPAQIDDEAPKGYGALGGANYRQNHGVEIVFEPVDTKDAERVSKQLGNTTVETQRITRSKGGRSVAFDQVARPLMLTQEIQRMGMWKQILFIRGEHPIYCDKIAYFNEAMFLNRLKEVSPSLQQLGDAIPTKAQLNTARQQRELQTTVPRLNVCLDAQPLPSPEAYESPIAPPTDLLSKVDDATFATPIDGAFDPDF